MKEYICIIIWALVVIATIVIEIQSVSLTSIWFSIAAFVALILAIFKVDILWQIIIFTVLSAGLLLATRPLIKKYTKKNKMTRTNADRLFEKNAIVTKQITKDDIGEVKINNDLWRAISKNGETFEIGEKVKILDFEGNKVIVEKIQQQ